MRKNVLRLVILAWLAISLYAGFSAWTDHSVPVVVEVAKSDANPSGLSTVDGDYRCVAVLKSNGPPRLLDDLGTVVRSDVDPCDRFRVGRQVLYGLDVVFALGALALTFVHAPRRWSEGPSSEPPALLIS